MEAINLSARFASGAQVILEQADDFFSPSSRRDHEFIPLEYDPDLVDQIEDDDDGFFYANAAVAAVAANEYHLYHHQKDGTAMSKFANQPSDLSQGLQFAYKNLSQNLGAAAQTIFAVPTEIIEQNNNNDMASGSPDSTSSSSQAKAVIRAVPVAVIKPMIGLTGAFQSIMVGLRNSIDPAMRLQSEDVSFCFYFLYLYLSLCNIFLTTKSLTSFFSYTINFRNINDNINNLFHLFY